MAQCKRCGLRKARFLSDLCNQCIDEPEPSPKREVPQVGKPQAPEQLKRLDALEELGGCIYYLLSWLIGLGVFLACWLYAVSVYGWFLGLAFGWIPAAIIATIAAFLWPLAALAALAVVVFYQTS